MIDRIKDVTSQLQNWWLADAFFVHLLSCATTDIRFQGHESTTNCFACFVRGENGFGLYVETDPVAEEEMGFCDWSLLALHDCSTIILVVSCFSHPFYQYMTS